MNELEKFQRHMNMPVEIELDNLDGTKDKFKIIPLTNMDLISFFNLTREMSKHFKEGGSKEEISDAMSKIPIELWDKLFSCLRKSVKGAYPDITEEVLDGFITKNFIELYPKIVEINSQVQESKKPIDVQPVEPKVN